MGGSSPGQAGGAIPNMMGESKSARDVLSTPTSGLIEFPGVIGMNMPGGAYNPMMMGMHRMVSPQLPQSHPSDLVN